jgi:hypothetical protein
VNRPSPIAVFLVVIGLLAVVLVAAGTGSDDARSPAPVPRGRALSDLATPEEYELWNARGCVTCHGFEARGTSLAPDLTRVIPLYVAKAGSAESARAAIAAYLLDPAGSPKLRADGAVFPNPMPPLEKLFGGRREDAPVLAGMLLRLAE